MGISYNCVGCVFQVNNLCCLERRRPTAKIPCTRFMPRETISSDDDTASPPDTEREAKLLLVAQGRRQIHSMG
ncbi:hypothetical protein JCM17960_08590 [Magnetospira thiophila]